MGRKKFPAETIRLLVDDFDHDTFCRQYYEKNNIEYNGKLDDLEIEKCGDWEILDTDHHYRITILKEISTGKYYKFEEISQN